MKKTLILALALTVAGLTTSFGAETKALWDKQCAKCHGKDGAGKTTMGKKLKVKDYTKAEDQKKFTDEEAIKITKEGKKKGSKTLMKGYASKLTDDEIKALVKYIRQMKK
jgi:cytochrome c553